MIRCTIQIAFVDGERRGLRRGVTPHAENPSDVEKVTWTFFGTMLECAVERIKEQMAENATRPCIQVHGVAESETMKELNRQMPAGAMRADFTVLDGMYFLLRSPESRHPIETGVWKTFYAALDKGTDFFNSEGFGVSYEDDQRNLREHLEEELAKLPVFPRLEPAKP